MEISNEGYYEYSNDPEIYLLSGIIISGTIIWFLTSMRILLFLGESERYLNFLFPFFALYFVISINSELIFRILVAYGILYLILEVVYYYLKSRKSNSFSDVIEFLQKEYPGRVMLKSFHEGGGGVWQTLVDTHHQVFYPVVAGDRPRAEYQKAFPEQNWQIGVNDEYLDLIAREYDINYLVIKKNELSNNMRSHDIVFDSGTLLVLRLKYPD